MSRKGIIGIKGLKVKHFGDKQESALSLPGITELKVTVNEESSTFYSDDMPSFVANALSSIEIEMSLLGLSNAEKAFLLGQRIDETTGILEENVNDIAMRKPVSLTFESELLDGGTKLVSIPSITFAPSEETAITKKDKVEEPSTSIKGSALPTNEGAYRVSVDVLVTADGTGETIDQTSGLLQVGATEKEAFLGGFPLTIVEAKALLRKKAVVSK